MKRALCCILIALLLVSQTATAFADTSLDSTYTLSSMTDEECIEFIKSNNIVIPSDYSESGWVNFIRQTIAEVENDPTIHFAYNYTKTLDFANAIKDAVNSFYGIRTPENTETVDSRAIIGSLKYSTLYGDWSETFRNYNCYAYALSKFDAPYNPGDFSGTYTIDISDDIYTLALEVKNDLQSDALNKECVIITQTCPDYDDLYNGQLAIAIRKGTVDYHFMKLEYPNVWHHKPGDTNTLTYNYLPNELTFWNNEAMKNGVYYWPDITYDSDVYFILYSRTHTTVNTTTGNHYHSGNKHFYEYADICEKCLSVIGNRTWKAVVCSGPPCTLQLSEPPLFYTY